MGKISVTGDKELDRILATFTPKIQKKLQRRACRRAAKPVLNYAKGYVPVRDGELEASLRIRGMQKIKQKNLVGVSVSTNSKSLFMGNTFYGGFQEFGTAFMEPNPYLRPAAIAAESESAQIFRVEIKQIIEEQAKAK